ncbi:MAG: hypothetical protein COB54_08370 [Alphaproteobacteria bacterium]|nr:MAG: hypothetical protein COB54_08370 [Alphaproteobacteria bacterium]
MKILVIHTPSAHQTDIVSALDAIKSPYVEVTGFRDGCELLCDSIKEIHTIIVAYSYVSEEPDFIKKLVKHDQLRDIPLILTLGGGDQADIKSFRLKASYQWLPQSFTDQLLFSMILCAENEFSQRRAFRREIASRQSVIGVITQGTFRIRTFEEAEALTTMLALTCPDPDRIAFGLFELIANGIEHGNLEIDHEEKWRLMENNSHRDEIKSRLARPEYKDRYVEIAFQREDNLVCFKIEDQGTGFNYADYLDVDFSSNTKFHGRGISLARSTSFDYLEYIGRGNKVMAIAKFALD